MVYRPNLHLLLQRPDAAKSLQATPPSMDRLNRREETVGPLSKQGLQVSVEHPSLLVWPPDLGSQFIHQK